jgi:ATPase family associated with various cellular activities (AAA)
MTNRAKSLEEYLSNRYSEDIEDIRAIESTLAAVATTYVATFDYRQACWPYEIAADSTTAEGKKSQGTSAMILSAIGKILGTCTLRNGKGSERIPLLADGLNKVFDAGLDSLFTQLRTDQKCFSSTFGDNDPLTTSHIAELVQALRASKYKGQAEAVLNDIPAAVSRIEKLTTQNPADVNSFNAALREGTPVQWSPRNAFLAVRVVRAHADIQGRPTVRSETFKGFFEAHIHQQLSFSSIPDSRFDPAELAFCLEGLLICAEEAVDPLLFRRVLSVLRANQETSAYWRPNRPFVANQKGQIILPLSVEGANSLLRATEILDKSKLHGTFAGEAVPMFRRFWQWLRARKIEFNALTKRCVGWHSEHINDPGIIHLWDTSQVVEFLVAFRAMIQRHIARETLVLSQVKIAEPDPELWAKVADRYEPLSKETGVKSDRVFDRVYSDFILPWQNHSPTKKFSMLVYGPPGTGKTTLARSIANALLSRLITITVSDFLGAGGALVEARAKAIFQMLEAQMDCVIFFDEIDAFLLDRDSKHYRKQDTLFQFLTPGMLTKINDLRERQRAIFIIATNYENRIDPAIKRTGRIDHQYLLLPPDLRKRHSILQGLNASQDSSILMKMAKAAVYLSYKDMRAAVENGGSENDVLDALKNTPRSSSYEVYLKRLRTETTFPYREFAAAVEMAQETDMLEQIPVNFTHSQRA